MRTNSCFFFLVLFNIFICTELQMLKMRIKKYVLFMNFYWVCFIFSCDTTYAGCWNRAPEPLVVRGTPFWNLLPRSATQLLLNFRLRKLHTRTESINCSSADPLMFPCIMHEWCGFILQRSLAYQKLISGSHSYEWNEFKRRISTWKMFGIQTGGSVFKQTKLQVKQCVG
jgi:hypothetical protein